MSVSRLRPNAARDTVESEADRNDPRIRNIYAVAKKHRDALTKRNADASERMYQSWLAVIEDLRPRIDAITARIDEARAASRTGDVNPAWLYQQARYRELLDGARSGFDQYANIVYNETTGLQRDAADRAIDAAFELVRGAFGGMVTDPALPHVLIRPGAEELRDLVGFLGDGSPLSRLFQSFGEVAAQEIARSLTVGVATGRSPIEIARSIRHAAGLPRVRAETIARTELHRAFRSATQRTFEANADVVTGWIWHAAQQRRTCAACWAMHGTFHPVTERLNGHVRCRCAMLPQTKTWEELGIEGVENERVTVPLGSDLFDRLSERDQLFILGKSKYDLFKSGEIALGDLAALHKNRIWGDSWQESTIAQARAAASARRKATVRASRPPRAPKNQEAAPTAPSFKPGPQVRAEIAEFYAAQQREIAKLRDIETEAIRASTIWTREYSLAYNAPAMTPERREEIRAEYERHRSAMHTATQNRERAERDGTRQIRERFLYTDPATFTASKFPRKPSGRSSSEAVQRYIHANPGLEAFRRFVGTGHLDAKTVQYEAMRLGTRAYYSGGRIHIDPRDQASTIVHELGHWLEEQSPGFHEEIYQHYQKRTAGETAEKLADITGNPNYRDTETSKRDAWINPYSGKDYAVLGSRNSEIVSMTLEQLYEDPYSMVTSDPETFDLVWRLLRSRNGPSRRRRRTT